MPLPKQALTISGGCLCQAIRYKIEVPEFDKRPRCPYQSPDAGIDVRLPMMLIGHCNDCRKATSSILSTACIAPSQTVQVALVREGTDSAKQAWQSSAEVFVEDSAALDVSYLGHYKSSPGRNRWFCSRCGTPIGYSIDDNVIPKEWKWPKMLDLWLGTVDREDLEREWMRPERMLWCHKGIPWIREMARNGAGGIPEHPLTKMDRLVGDDIEEDLRELAGLGKS